MNSLSYLLGLDDYSDVHGTQIQLLHCEYETHVPVLMKTVFRTAVKEPRPRSKTVHKSSGGVSKTSVENRRRFLHRKNARWYNKGRFTTIPDYNNILDYTSDDFVQNASRCDEHMWNLIMCVVEVSRKSDHVLGEMTGFHSPTMDHVRNIVDQMLSNDRIIFEENDSGCVFVRIHRHGLEDLLSLTVTDNILPVIVNNGKKPSVNRVQMYFNLFIKKIESHKEKKSVKSHLDKINFIGGYFKVKYI